MIVYGKQVVLHLLKQYPHKIKEIYLSKEIDSKIFTQMKQLAIKIIRIDSKKAQAMARGGNHQGIFACIDTIECVSITQILSYSHLVILCGVSDVGNIGSLIRSATALGVDAMILEGHFSSKAQEAMMRLSSGAMLDLPIYFCPLLLDVIHQLKHKGFQCLGADMQGIGIDTLGKIDKWALFLGSEGEGLRKKIIQKMDKIVSIEMKGFNSLNVSVAGGILMHRLVANG